MCVPAVPVRLRRQPGRYADGMRILGFLRGDQSSFHHSPQQRGVRLVGEEELAEAVHLGQDALRHASLGRRVGLQDRELCVLDEVRDQGPDGVAVVRCGVPGGPGADEALAEVLRRRRLAPRGQGERVEGRPYVGQPGMSRTGEQGDRPRLIPGQLGQVPNPERLRDPQDHGQLGHLQAPALHLLDPAGRFAQQPGQDGTAHPPTGPQDLHALTKSDRLDERIRRSI